MKNLNKNTNLIIRYFEGELNSAEKEKFLNELQTNTELKKEFDSIKNIYDLKADLSKIKLDQEYLNSILPNFRAKLKGGSERKLFYPKFASAFAVIVIALALLLLLPEGNQKVTTEFSDIPDEELIQQLSQDFSVLIQEDKIDSLFKAEIKSAPDKISYYVFNGDDIENLYQKNLITPEDENEIYLSLIDKKF